MDFLALALPSLASSLAIAKVVLGFGAVIFIHEFGHYLMARRNGVFVEKFAIGFDFFGAKLFTWHRKGTEYVVGAFPLGGYVKMKGQHDMPGDEDTTQDEDSFQSKSIWQRTQIISAGVIANFLSAFVLCYLALVLGYHSSPPQVGQIGFDELQAGMRPGDEVVELDGKSVSSFDKVFMIFATEEPGTQLAMTVERDGREVDLEIPVKRPPGADMNWPGFLTGVETRVGILTAGLPAEKAGVKPGDRLVSVDGHPIETWGDFEQLVRRRGGQEMTLGVERVSESGLEQLALQVTPEARSSHRIPKYRAGFEPDLPSVVDYVEQGGPAWEAGIRPGDRVTAVGEQPVTSWYGLWRESTWGVAEGAPVPLTVQRGDQQLSFSVTPTHFADWGRELEVQSHRGIRIAGKPADALVVGRVDPEFGPKELMAGDVIVSVSARVTAYDGSENDWSMKDPDWRIFLSALNTLVDPVYTVEVKRGGQVHEFTIPVTEDPGAVTIGHVGVGPHQNEEVVQVGPVEAIVPALKAPFVILEEFAMGLMAMGRGDVSTKLLSGPVGILQVTYIFAEKSIGDLLKFLALLSVNLAVVNFLPIPITDGGHFVFLMYEKVKGKKMEDEMMARFQWAGLVFLLIVFIYVTFNDVERLVGF